MISAPITDMTANMSGASFPSSYSNKNSGAGKAFDDIISSVSTGNVDVTDAKSVSDAFTKKNLDMANDMANMGAENTTKEVKSNEVAETSKVSNDSQDTTNTYKKDVDNSSDNAKVTEDSAKGLDDNTKETIENDVLKKVSDDLEISPEELEEILENLGLTVLDLANPQVISNLVAEVKADGDMMALITDENLGNLVKDINLDVKVTLEDVSSDLGISMDELMAKIQEEVSTSSDEVNISKPYLDINKAEDLPADNILNTVSKDESANKDNVKIIDDSINDNDNASGQLTEANNVNTEKDSSDNSSNNSNENNKNNDSKMGETVSLYGQQQMNADAVLDQNVVNDFNDTLHMVDTKEIISQIEEHMKLQMKDGITELQMQLNPENLGTVHLTLASRESGVTAQLTAQNESVKQALESQIVVLRQNLEEQGVKVEAVEVTVSSHEFERNLDEGNEENRQQQEEAEKLRKATRKLNIDDYFADENIEELDEELQVTAKMMRADGNAMDYKV